MTALTVRHVGIVTKNLKSSIKFYKDILGFKIIKKMEETDPSLSQLMDLKKVKVTTVKMLSKQNGMVELLSWKSPQTKKKVSCNQLITIGSVIVTSMFIRHDCDSLYPGPLCFFFFSGAFL